jgi:hypothetical protein
LVIGHQAAHQWLLALVSLSPWPRRGQKPGIGRIERGLPIDSDVKVFKLGPVEVSDRRPAQVLP